MTKPEKMVRHLWLRGKNTLAKTEEGLQAILHQLEDMNPPGTELGQPAEVQERFNSEMLSKGYIVPIQAVLGTKEEAILFREQYVKDAQEKIEKIKAALGVIQQIRGMRGES